ncbi:MAG: S1 RNA-binding domain-containing protein [Firmicutes bacterium]|nr:S1 RNA-binding domain-containing protein [Bacillota bacterium]
MESMESFADLFEASFQRVNNGDIVEGTILQVSGDTAVVDIGSYMDGILAQDELLYDGENWEQYPEGTRLTLMVKRVDTRNSQILLSKKEADKVVIWDELEEKKAEPASILVRVKSAVKGGLRIQYKSVQGFIPASQVEDHYVEELDEYVGQDLEVLIINVDREKRDFTGSRKELIRKAEKVAKQTALSALKPGDRLTGRVVKLERYGAFVELQPGVIGLLHVSDMAWTRIKHPSDMVNVGDPVTVSVQEIDKERGRISLSLKAVGENPWDNLPFSVGDVLGGKEVTHMIASGAFVKLTDVIEGFIPISQISEKRIQNVREVLDEGDVVNVKVLRIDADQQRISLTMKEVPQGEDAVLDMPTNYNVEDEDVTSSLGDAFAKLVWKDED